MCIRRWPWLREFGWQLRHGTGAMREGIHHYVKDKSTQWSSAQKILCMPASSWREISEMALGSDMKVLNCGGCFWSYETCQQGHDRTAIRRIEVRLSLKAAEKTKENWSRKTKCITTTDKGVVKVHVFEHRKLDKRKDRNHNGHWMGQNRFPALKSKIDKIHHNCGQPNYVFNIRILYYTES